MDKAFRYFEVVAEVGSIRQAAEQLHTSPSSVSRQITKLEHRYGARLLVRHANGVKLTPAGEVVARYVQSQSRELRRLYSAIDALTNLQSGSLTIYTVEGTVGGLLPDALARFSADYPGIDFTVCIAGTDDVMRAVAEDRCDFGMSYYPHPRPDVESILSIRQPLLAVMAPTHPLASRPEIELQELRGEPIGIPDRSFGIRNLVEHVIKQEQMDIDIRLETNSIGMVRQFAGQGMGVGFLPAFSFERDARAGTLVGIPLKNVELTEATLQICKRRETELYSPAARLVSYLAKAASDARRVP